MELMTYFIQDCEKNLESMNIHCLNFSPSLHNHHFLTLQPKETFFRKKKTKTQTKKTNPKPNKQKRSSLPEGVAALL